MHSALTEAEARERWCPFARSPQSVVNEYGLGLVGACNMQDDGSRPPRLNCIASGCMAWRWAGWETKTSGWLAPNPDVDDRVGDRRGFCGLAGAPK